MKMVELSKIIGIILNVTVSGDNKTWNNNSSCETSAILINTSDSGNDEIWCPTYNDLCKRQLKDIFGFWIGGVIHNTIGFAGILMNIMFCYVFCFVGNPSGSIQEDILP